MGCLQSTELEDCDKLRVTKQPSLLATGMNRLEVSKVILLGASGVGKTSIVRKATLNTYDFLDPPQPTIGAAYSETRRVMSDGKEVRWRLWDTGGQERFKSLCPIYCRGAAVCLLVYDITSSSSFESMKSWYREALTEISRPDSSECIFLVVGSKWARTISAEHVEVSSKTGVNLGSIFDLVYLKLRLANPLSLAHQALKNASIAAY